MPSIRLPVVTFETPSRDVKSIPPNASREVLRSIVLREEPDYWNAGAGDVLVRFRSRERYAVIGVMYKPRYGFMLTHNYKMDRKYGNEMHFSDSGRPFKRKISLVIGGNSSAFWEAYFISSDQALLALEDFVGNGSRSVRISWIPLGAKR